MSFTEFALYLIQGLTTGASYALVAVAISLIYSVSHVINFALGAIAAVAAIFGGYSLAIGAGLPAGIALVLAVLLAGIISVAVGFVLLLPGRLQGGGPGDGRTWIIAAVASSIVISEVASLIWGTDQVVVHSVAGEGIIRLGEVTIRVPALVLILAAVVVGLGLDQFLRRSRWGLRVRAAGGDQIGVAVSRLPLNRILFQVFFVGGCLAGLTGMLIGPLNPPSTSIGFALTINAFIAAVIGGLGHLRGAVLGGFVVGLLQAFGGRILGPQWQDPIALTVLVLVLLITPTGIIPRRQERIV